MFSAITRAGVRDDYADALFGNAERLRQFTADTKRPLRAGPDRELVSFPFGYRGAWFQRRVSDIGNGVALLNLVIRRLQTLFHRTSVASSSAATLACRCILFQIAEELRAGRLILRGPLGLECFDRFARRQTIRRSHSNEIAVMHDSHTLHRLSRFWIERFKLRIKGRRSKHLPVQHAGQLHVRAVFMISGDDGAAIDFVKGSARDLPLIRWRRLGFVAD